MKHRTIALSALSLILAAGTSAQDVQPAAEAPQPEPKLVGAPTINATYSDAEIEKAASLLIGTWTTAAPVAEFEGEGMANLVMSIGPARVTGISDALYVELAREGEVATPYRQAIYQLYRYKGTLRLRTFDLRTEQAAQALMGMSLVPEYFPETVTARDVYPTIDIDLAPKGSGYAGQSPAAYPDHRGGAVQMTSAISFDGQTISVTDIGYNSSGDVAWQVGRDGGVEFVRAEDVVDIQRYDDGLTIISFEEPDTDKIQDGDWMVIHYLGKLTDGTKFDASFDRGEPFRYKYPATNLVQGWNRGVEGMAKGSRRRIVIPPALGWGDRSVGPIPPNSTVIFDVECVFIEKDVPAPAPDAAPAAEPATPEGE